MNFNYFQKIRQQIYAHPELGYEEIQMDALPLTETTQLPYQSKISGKMHACGHDGHTATLLAAAHALTQRTQQFNGKIKFIFQPAEEGGGAGDAQSHNLESPDFFLFAK